MTRKIITFFIFCWSLCLAIYAQTDTINIDSLILVAEKMPNDTASIRVIQEMGYEVSENDLENGLYFFRKSYNMSKQLKSDFWIPWTGVSLGSMLADFGEADSALLYFQSAQKIYEKQGNEVEIRRVFEKMTWVYHHFGEYDKALTYAFKGLKIAENMKNEPHIALHLSDIAWISGLQYKHKEEFSYAEKAYKIQKKLQDWEGFSFSAEIMSHALMALGDYTTALVYIEEAIEAQKKVEDDLGLANVLTSRGDIFIYLKKYPEALADYEYVLNLSRKSGQIMTKSKCLASMGEVYTLLEQHQKALPYLLEAQQLIAENKDINLSQYNLELLSEAYAGVKKYDSAYYFHQLYKTVSDSIRSSKSENKMNELRIKYETEKKEEQISEQNRNLWILGGAFFVAILGGIGLFFLTRQLRKRNTEKDNLLKEKEFLIKEVHHRVKNNLQVLSSLLYLQSRHIKDEAALDAVREGQNRVEAMGLIHQKLYMGNALATVEMKDYLQNLGEMLLDAFGIEDDRVVIDYQVDTLQLDVDTAIPLGLIINELITNSLKYAFSKNETGKIAVSLWKNEAGKLCLKVADNGKGIIQTENTSKSTSFGSNLIKVLSQKLKGKPEITKSEAGYSTYIECGSV